MNYRRVSTNLVVMALLAVVYFGAAKLGLQLAFVNASASAVWPPTGVALAALLLFGPRVWPGIFIGAFAANVTTAGAFATSVMIATGNTLEGLAGMWLARRYANGLDAFTRVTDVLRFIVLSGLLAPVISATIGVGSLGLDGLMALDMAGMVWLTWWLGDAVGSVVVAPFLMLWGQWHGWGRILRPGTLLSNRKWFEAILLVLASLAVGWIVFGTPNTLALAFICTPVLVWAAFRFGARAAATLALLLSVIAIWGTLQAQGPFYRSTPHESLLMLQAFIGVTVAMSLMLAAAVAERTRAGDALRESEQRFRATFEQAAVGIAHVAHSGTWLRVNQRLCEIVGYTREELLQHTFQDITHPDDLDADLANIQRMLANEISTYSMEKRYIRKDGSLVWINLTVSLVREADSTPNYFISVLEDITERKLAEGALKQTADRLRHLREIDQSILARRPLAEIAQATVSFLWDLLACTRVSVMQVDIETGTLTLFATRDQNELRAPVGLQAPLDILGDALDILKQGQIYQVPDVAGLAELAPALRAARVEHVRRYCYVPVVVDTHLIGVIGLGADAPGLFSSEQLDIIREVADQLSIAMQQARLQEQVERHAAELEQRVAERTSELKVALGRMEALYSVTRTAIASEDWLAILQYMVDQVATSIPANRVSLIIFDEHKQRVIHFIRGGPGREHITTVSFDELLEGLTGWVIREGRSAHSPTGVPDPRESAAVQKRRVETNCGAIMVAPLRYQEQILGTITAIKQPQEPNFSEADIELIEAIAGQIAIAHIRATLYERLQQAKARLAGILDIADDAIITVNARQEIELFNQGAERIFGYTAQEVIGQTLGMLLPTAIAETHHQHIQIFAASPDVARRMGERGDIFGRRRDGSEFPAEASISKLITPNETVFTVILRDITTRKQVETRLRASVREKEILLQEVHHRVKNNLQIIKSLLRLQAYATGDLALRGLFRDSQNRVHAMALVHEQLYRGHDLAHIDCATYLRELATSVVRSYSVQPSQVRLVFEAQTRVALDIDTAIPLGLILTELISNSLKHAFPDNRTGTITISLHADTGIVTLAVRDDGIGLAGSFDLGKASSLGLRLVRDLAEQLDGSVTVDSSLGTLFQIQIPHISAIKV